ncbi:MAG: hypothetical protein HZC44_03745 [Geobacter sp.]|nr:hypothetical protein [Geobacter sp.]
MSWTDATPLLMVPVLLDNVPIPLYTVKVIVPLETVGETVAVSTMASVLSLTAISFDEVSATVVVVVLPPPPPPQAVRTKSMPRNKNPAFIILRMQGNLHNKFLLLYQDA